MGIGVARLDPDGVAEVFVRSAGRAGERVAIAQFDGCALDLVRNVEGQPYAFDVGTYDGVLVGMGCVDVDRGGDLELISLAGRLDGEDYRVDRTVVEIADGRADDRGGDTVPVPAADPAAVTLIRSATCGDDLLETSGSRGRR